MPIILGENPNRWLSKIIELYFKDPQSIPLSSPASLLAHRLMSTSLRGSSSSQAHRLVSTPLRGSISSLAHRPVSGSDTICNSPSPPLENIVPKDSSKVSRKCPNRLSFKLLRIGRTLILLVLDDLVFPLLTFYQFNIMSI